MQTEAHNRVGRVCAVSMHVLCGRLRVSLYATALKPFLCTCDRQRLCLSFCKLLVRCDFMFCLAFVQALYLCVAIFKIEFSLKVLVARA
jgi:hypothetical protein